MVKRSIVAVITAVTGSRIVIGTEELHHSKIKHFRLVPTDIVLELVTRILKDPTHIYVEQEVHFYHLFYRLEDKRYLVVVIKEVENEWFFSSIYSTGEKIRHKHKKLKRLKHEKS